MNKITISRLQLKEDYKNMMVSDICNKYGICLARLYKLLKECGIEKKWSKSPKREYKKIIIKD